jgi:hypothetical protein
MHNHSRDDEEFVKAREMLAVAPKGLGRYLRRSQKSDPEVAMERAIAALAAIRTSLRTDTVLASTRGLSVERLGEWEQELAASTDHLQSLWQTVHDEVHLTLRERNRRRFDLLPPRTAEESV